MLEDLDQDLVDDLFLVSFSGYSPLFAFVLCLEFKVQYILNSRLCCLQHVNPATPPVAPRFVRPTYNPSGNQECNNITVFESALKTIAQSKNCLVLHYCSVWGQFRQNDTKVFDQI